MEKRYTAQIIQFGLIIRRLRESKNWSQQELADRCEVDIRTIQRVEKGEFQIRLPIVFALADAFEMKYGQILSGLD